MAMPRERYVDVVEERPATISYVGPALSWGGVIAGLLVGAGLVLLLGVLGLAVGATIVSDVPRLGFAASMWVGLSVLIALFVGGMVAGRATNQPDRAGAVIQGTLVWILGVLVALGFVMSGLQGLGLLTRGMVVSGLAAATATAPDDAARALDDLRARVAPLRDDPVRLAAEVQAFFARYPERGPVSDPAAAIPPQSRLGWWIGFGALLLTWLVAVGGALTGTPSPGYE
jgi:hypothetical protein